MRSAVAAAAQPLRLRAMGNAAHNAVAASKPVPDKAARAEQPTPTCLEVES
jgi:hypothetical protein